MTTDSSQPPQPVKSTPKPRSAQSKKIERDLISLEQLLLALLAEPTDIAAELAEGGYTLEALKEMQGKQRTAFQIFVAQGAAEQDQKTATKAFLSAEKATRTFYRQLRTKGKSAFMKDPEGRAKLKLDGVEPKALKDLIGAGRALVLAGSAPDYAARLAKKAVTAANLTKLGQLLDTLEAADLAQETAKSAAPKATAQRDATAQALADWVSEFKMFAKGQFGDRPEILKRWGVIK